MRTRNDLEAAMDEAFWIPLAVLLAAGFAAAAYMAHRRRRAEPVKGINGEEYRPTMFV